MMLLQKTPLTVVVWLRTLLFMGSIGVVAMKLAAEERGVTSPPHTETDKKAVPLPAWVPAPGEVAVLTQNKGTLTNHFRDIAAPYFEPFYSVKIVNDYSGAFKNPYWGTYGCTVFFGGGHAACNDNMVAIAEYGQKAITFKRVCDPTPWFGTGTDATTKYRNSRENANEFLNRNYMESTIDGKPGAPHSYGSGDIVGPEFGGATHGTFIQVLSAAVNAANGEGAIAAHELRFEDMSTPSNQRKWFRVTDDFLANQPQQLWAPPILTAFVGPQKRVYIQANCSVTDVRWFDLETKKWITGTGTTFGYDYADGCNSGILFYVPSRELLVCMYPLDGKLTVQWMDVTVAQPTLGGTATLSQALDLSVPWSAGCWCSHNNRIIVAGVKGDNSAVYEIEIPAMLSKTWTVSRAPFGAGQTVVPPDAAVGSGFTYKKFHYDEKVSSIVYMPNAAVSGDDTVFVYRPRNTRNPSTQK